MRANPQCPCGEVIVGEDEDDLVAKAQAHLREKHPGMEYTPDEILFMAYCGSHFGRWLAATLERWSSPEATVSAA